MSTKLHPILTEHNTSVLRGRFALRSGRTVLTERYHEAPLKISKTFILSPAGELLVYMMDSSPGILDGDAYVIDFCLEEDTHVYLTNQSYTKVHPTPSKPSMLKQTFQLQRGAVLEYFPEPLIPYADSKFTTETIFHMEQGATLFFGDIITPGRIHHGELFQYDSLDSHMETYRRDQLIAWEHFHLQPKLHRYQELGALETYTHMGTLWIFSEQVDESLISEIRQLFPDEGLLIGTSLTADKGIIVRMLGHQVWKLQAMMQTLTDCCRTRLLGKSPLHIRR